MDNPGGLRLHFHIDEENKTLSTEFVPPEIYQGWDGIVHGGILSTLLDEAVAKLAYELGYDAVTAKLVLTFRKPARVNRPLKVYGKLDKITSRLIEGSSRIEDAEGKTVAEGQARLVRVSKVKA
jgi:uncharacterized protein (TIGR00369 family)